MLLSLKQIYPHIQYTSLRLAGIDGGGAGYTETVFMPTMIHKVLRHENIIAFNGTQQIERLHVADATEAILQLLSNLHPKLKPIYNLGFGTSYSLKHLAELIVEAAANINGTPKVDIIVEPSSEEFPSFGMSSDLFFSEFNWKPKYSMESTIISIIKYIKSQK
jgi:nucleoside-diphosphate-sugar epimerase